jgi:ParB family chromosome partitioning protein
LVQTLPIEQIDAGHLIRDRVALDEGDMAALEHSLRARGQQMPIEVVALEGGRFGLISGWRRIEALRRLGQVEVLALVRAPQGASEAYVAMIEENEVRANLSFYERARLATEATRVGVYPTVQQAVQGLFASASASKRSKILNFVSVHEAFGSNLAFPAAIPERLGLALAAAALGQEGFTRRLKDVLRKAGPENAAEERALLERALRKAPAAPSKPQLSEERYGAVGLKPGKDRIVLSGVGVDESFLQDLRAWLSTR